MDSAGGKSHILALNHSQDVLSLIRDVLVEDGYRVTTALLMDGTIEWIIDLAPDLIILDYLFAREDRGWSLLQELRMDSRTAAIPAILCTGAVRDVEEMKSELDSMRVRIIFKPFDIDDLVKAVSEMLDASGH